MTLRHSIVRMLRNHGIYPTTLAFWWRDVPLPTRVVNFAFQRLLRLNCGVREPVHFTSTIVCSAKLRVHPTSAKSLAVSGGCYIQAGNGITIGQRTIWAPGVKLISANHGLADDRAWVEASPLEIGDDCWIGANAVILPGVVLGNNTVVGAGAVVTKSFPEGNCVLVGNPARIIRTTARSDQAATE